MPEDDVPELSERFLGGMALAQTPRQQEAAREIYRELAAGEDVDDIKPLIERMLTIVVEERNKHRPEAAGPPAREPRRERNDQWSEGE